jgi:hypothetical protein
MTKQRNERITPTNNKVHFACFDCRKAFKQQGSSNWDSRIPERPFPCPNCKRPMARLGRYFKVPQQRATRQWLKVELLYHFGQRFESSNLRTKEEWRTLGSVVAALSRAGSAAEVREQLTRIRNSHHKARPSSGR